MPAQGLRRVYYIQIDKTFEETKKNEGDLYYNNIMDKINNRLFKDFCYKICKRIQEGEALYYNSVDWLLLERNLFKEYYQIVGREIPVYFPESPFYDYNERGKILWKTLFHEKPGIFSYKSEKDELVVNFESIEKGANMYSRNMEDVFYKKSVDVVFTL